jgi:hypothetical protein
MFGLPRVNSKGRDLFPSFEDALEFTKKRRLDDAHVGLLVDAHRLTDAADFLLVLERTLEAHQILVQDFENESSMHRVIQYTINSLWRHLSLGLVKHKRTKRAIDELLHLATQLNGAMLDSNQVDEVG